MVTPHLCDNVMQLRLNEINLIKEYFIVKISERETMRKNSVNTFQHLVTLTLLVSVASFTNVIGALVGITRARHSLYY